PGERRDQLRDSAHGLELAERLAPLDLVAAVGEIGGDHLAQLGLAVLRDADLRTVPFDAQPEVILGEFQDVRHWWLLADGNGVQTGRCGPYRGRRHPVKGELGAIRQGFFTAARGARVAAPLGSRGPRPRRGGLPRLRPAPASRNRSL